MQNRGFTPSLVVNAIQNGNVYPTKVGTLGYYDSVNKLRVITDINTKKIITVIRGAP